MSDNADKKRRELAAIQGELSQGRLSRRAFLSRLKLLGIGFGAAHMLGLKEADAARGIEPEVGLRSTDAALDAIREEAMSERGESVDDPSDVPEFQVAQYARRPYARAPFARAPFARAPFARAPFARAPFARAPFARAPFARAPFARAPFARAPFARAPYARRPG